MNLQKKIAKTLSLALAMNPNPNPNPRFRAPPIQELNQRITKKNGGNDTN